MKIKLLPFLVFFSFTGHAQELEHTLSTTEQQLENLAQSTDAEPKDDSYLQSLDHYKKHPLNLNTAGAEELSELNMLSGLQIEQLLLYRKLMGKFINLYELQAVPAWDIATIKELLPFIKVSNDKNLVESLQGRWTGGDVVFIARYDRVLEKSKGYDKPVTAGVNYYLGSRDKLYLRYQYNYKNLLQWGLLGDKDAGEQFFKGYQKQGFDFYSFHFFARKLGVIKALALGDFTVNFGQGLLQWQSIAFKKSAGIVNIKRQAAALRPYNSAGEYNFHRGAGITLQKGKWETTVFASLKKVSANTVPDTSANDGAISSFLASGYHRTAAENDNKNSLQQITIGGNLVYNYDNLHAGINTIHDHFSKPVQKQDEPYNLFALQGTTLANTSIDYSYTWRNMHIFGEASADNRFSKAFVNGIIISTDAKADVSIVYRNISRAYRSLNADAFTENTFPVNERGLYAGVSLRPFSKLQVNAYADLFTFPWIKYRVDAPSAGKDYLIQATCTPDKRVELYIRYKCETKMINRSGSTATTGIIDAIPVQNLRVQSGIVVNKELTCKNRVELLWYNKQPAANAGQGFLTYIETYYKPARKYWQGNLRFQYFETNGYNTRIYTYEADMPYNFSIPFYYDKGVHYYFNLNWDATHLITRKKQPRSSINCWLRWSQTIYEGKTSIGTALDEINGNHRSELKFQLIMNR